MWELTPPFTDDLYIHTHSHLAYFTSVCICVWMCMLVLVWGCWMILTDRPSGSNIWRCLFDVSHLNILCWSKGLVLSAGALHGHLWLSSSVRVFGGHGCYCQKMCQKNPDESAQFFHARKCFNKATLTDIALVFLLAFMRQICLSSQLMLIQHSLNNYSFCLLFFHEQFWRYLSFLVRMRKTSFFHIPCGVLQHLKPPLLILLEGWLPHDSHLLPTSLYVQVPDSTVALPCVVLELLNVTVPQTPVVYQHSCISTHCS